MKDVLEAARRAEEACDGVAALEALDAGVLVEPRCGEAWARRGALSRMDPIGLRLETSWQDDVARARALDPRLGLRPAKDQRLDLRAGRLDLSGVEVKDGTLARRVGPHLRLLDLSGTEVGDRGLACLATAPDLRALSLAFTNVRGPGLSVLDALPALRSLRLRGLTGLCASSVAHVAGARALVDLDLSFAGAATRDALSALAGLPALTGLALAGCALGDDASVLQALGRLERLTLAGCSGASDALVTGLAALPRLRVLSLAGTAVGAPGLAALAAGAPALEVLDLRGLDLGLPGVVDALVALAPRLRALDLGAVPPSKPGARLPATTSTSTSTSSSSSDRSHDAADDAALARIAAAATDRLAVLRLSGRALGARGAAALRSLTGLASLDLAGTHVDPAHLPPLPALREVDLSGAPAARAALAGSAVVWLRNADGWVLVG